MALLLTNDLDECEVKLAVAELGLDDTTECNRGVDLDLGVFEFEAAKDVGHLAQHWLIIAAQPDGPRELAEFEAGYGCIMGIQNALGVNQKVLPNIGEGDTLVAPNQKWMAQALF